MIENESVQTENNGAIDVDAAILNVKTVTL